MHTADSIRAIEFSRSMSGYKHTEVNEFIEIIASEFEQLTNQNRALGEKLSQVMKDLEDSKGSQNNIQSVLVSAQRFADQIVGEAKAKAQDILDEAHMKAKEVDEKIDAVLAAFEQDISERNRLAEKEISTRISDAAVKSESLITAAHDSVARQQLLFDKIKVEADAFKSNLLDAYKQQLEIISKFPTNVPYDPRRAAEATSFTIDKIPDFDNFIPQTEEESTISSVAPISLENVLADEQSEQEESFQTGGFNVTLDEEEVVTQEKTEQPEKISLAAKAGFTEEN